MTYDADKLVAVYIRMRDTKEALSREYDGKLADINTQMEVIEQALLDICKANGQDGGKTAHGTFTRTVKSRYWTTDWESMKNFVRENDALDLLERRIHQTNMKQFLKENPNKVPEGLNVESKYSVIVRRATNKD